MPCASCRPLRFPPGDLSLCPGFPSEPFSLNVYAGGSATILAQGFADNQLDLSISVFAAAMVLQCRSHFGGRCLADVSWLTVGRRFFWPNLFCQYWILPVLDVTCPFCAAVYSPGHLLGPGEHLLSQSMSNERWGKLGPTLSAHWPFGMTLELFLDHLLLSATFEPTDLGVAGHHTVFAVVAVGHCSCLLRALLMVLAVAFCSAADGSCVSAAGDLDLAFCSC